MKRTKLQIEDGFTWWEQMIKDEEDRKELKMMIDDVNLLTPEELENNLKIYAQIDELRQHLVEYHNGKKVIQKKPFRLQ